MREFQRIRRMGLRIASSILVDTASLRRLCHVRNMTSRGLEGFPRMILHTADLLETVSNIALSGRFA